MIHAYVHHCVLPLFWVTKWSLSCCYPIFCRHSSCLWNGSDLSPSAQHCQECYAPVNYRNTGIIHGYVNLQECKQIWKHDGVTVSQEWWASKPVNRLYIVYNICLYYIFKQPFNLQDASFPKQLSQVVPWLTWRVTGLSSGQCQVGTNPIVGGVLQVKFCLFWSININGDSSPCRKYTKNTLWKEHYLAKQSLLFLDPF